jgi:antirestriction protein ArdC
VFWKHWELPSEGENVSPKRPAIPLLRYYRVFNVDQVEGVNLPPLPTSPMAREHERIERAEIMIRDMPNQPTIKEGGRSAWYRPADDVVSIPALRTFASSDAYYSTLLHELGHSTGHEKRLNRKGVTGKIQFGSADYSQEELVAELASSFCCAELGLDNSLLENSASYIHGWLSVFEGNPKMVVVAAAQAHRAADLIKGSEHQQLEEVA